MVNVAVVTGVCVERDAISAAAVDQAQFLAGFDQVGDVTLLAHSHARASGVRTIGVADSWRLAAELDRLAVDVAIFHWGIYYDLFNALPVVAADRRTAVHFHNVTPAEFVPQEFRPLIEQSVRQMQLPHVTGSALWADSAHNRDTLEGWGYPASSVRLLPLIGARAVLPRHTRQAGDPVRLLTVGRLVPAKGVDVLVAAIDLVATDLDHPIELVLAGSTEFSDHAFIARLSAAIADLRRHATVRIEEDLDDAALDAEYARADILVSPSLHEGLCIPVIEAYNAGLRVVASNAGNLPYVVQPPDPVVPAGDPVALAEAIVGVAREILAGSSALAPGADELVRRHSPAGVRAELADAFVELMSHQPSGLRAST